MKKTVLGSKKPFYEPNVLRGKDKIKSTGPILGGSPKKEKPLDKKFVGCSKEINLGSNKEELAEESDNFSLEYDLYRFHKLLSKAIDEGNTEDARYYEGLIARLRETNARQDNHFTDSDKIELQKMGITLEAKKPISKIDPLSQVDWVNLMRKMWKKLSKYKRKQLSPNKIYQAAREISTNWAGEHQNYVTEKLITAFMKRSDGIAKKIDLTEATRELFDELKPAILNYNEFANAQHAINRKCANCQNIFKTIHSPNQKFCSLECDRQSIVNNKLQEAFFREHPPIEKAGFIPYFIDGENQVHMLFCKSSNPIYGGDKFMLAKGHVDSGENAQQAALREAREECGLIESNIVPGTLKIGWKGEITGYTETSTMTVFVAQVKDPKKFNNPHFEISETKWMTPEEYFTSGRQSQKFIVKACTGKI